MDETDTDDFKWFGEGFDGFPKYLPADCVEYTLYIINSSSRSQKEVLSRLEAVRKEASKLTSHLLQNYIWQRDPFKLNVENNEGVFSLHGLTNYGDSVEDEWLVVYILKKLSHSFADLWVRVVDTDGEFLLIEAANALPRWLNPEIADKRVWINGGSLRIIPLEGLSIPSTPNLALGEALKVISTSPESLIHSSLIEEEAFYRIQRYPSQIQDSLHHASVKMPRKLAYILHERPASIAPAIEAFYLRDPISLKTLETPGSLMFSTKDLVTVSTTFTRTLYAQVKSQNFDPPSVWRELISRAEMEGGKVFSQLEIGMKVTSGFEMLFRDSKNADNRFVREIQILLDDIAADGDESSLPTDEEIAAWKDVNHEDDEKWLDINFEDFERELDGKKGARKTETPGAPPVFGPERPPKPSTGFGDPNTEADVKKMVERFESFLNDEDAGIDGAEMDDDDDDSDSDDDDDSEYEDKEVSFDEKEFSRLMRQMMGMPSADANDNTETPVSDTEVGAQEIHDEEELEEIQSLMRGMEMELNAAGALDLDPKRPREKQKGKSPIANEDPSQGGKPKKKGKAVVTFAESESDDGTDDDDDEVDVDFNLAKNLLESFKSQAGMAGPGGNLMGMMGMRLPRDESD